MVRKRDKYVKHPLCSKYESEILKGAAKKGLGITLLPETFCMNELSEGSLIHVLPEWSAGSVTTSLLMLTRRGLLPSVNITADFG